MCHTTSKAYFSSRNCKYRDCLLSFASAMASVISTAEFAVKIHVRKSLVACSLVCSLFMMSLESDSMPFSISLPETEVKVILLYLSG